MPGIRVVSSGRTAILSERKVGCNHGSLPCTSLVVSDSAGGKSKDKLGLKRVSGEGVGRFGGDGLAIEFSHQQLSSHGGHPRRQLRY